MPDKDYREVPLTWERGLVETVEDSMLPPGAAASLVNWQPDPSGNLRARVGWSKASTTGAPATRKGMGIGHLALPHRPYLVQPIVSDEGTGTTVATATATWGGATTNGNLLLLKIGATTNVAAVADNFVLAGVTGWTLAKRSPSANTSVTGVSWIYYKANAASESSAVAVSVTPTGAGACSIAIEISEIANITTSSPLDQTAESDGTTETTLASGTTAAQSTPVGYAVSAITHVDSADNAYSAPTNSFVEQTELYSNNGSVNDLNFITHNLFYETNAALGHDVTSDNAGATWRGCIATFKALDYTTTDGFYFVANNETTEIVIYYIDRDNLVSGTWAELETITVSPDVLPVAFTSGFEKLLYTHPSFTAAREWSGIGTTPAAISGAPNGRCIATHKSRLYIGGTPNQPWRLHASEVGDITTWSQSIDVNEGDGEAIEDITPHEDGLIIAKQTSLWYLLGSGPDSWRLIRLPIGGAAPGRTVLSTPYGALVAGRENAWLVNGGSVSLISRPINDSYGITGNWMCISYLDEIGYILDQGSGTIWAINFALNGPWHLEQISSASTEGPAIIFNHDEKQLFTPKNATVGSLLSYRMIPGSSRAKDFDTLSEAYTAWTPEMWLVGPEQKITPRYLFLKIRQRGGDAADTDLTVTPIYDGRTQTAQAFEVQASAGVYRDRISVGEERGISSVQFKFTQTLASTEAAVLDIEEATFSFDVEKVR